jgi:hypothetical protein
MRITKVVNDEIPIIETTIENNSNTTSSFYENNLFIKNIVKAGFMNEEQFLKSFSEIIFC